MNCATHNDVAAVAFCRTCGKPLCNQCTRDVRGVIYCESCLAARMEGAASAAGYVPPAQTVYPPMGAVPPLGAVPPGIRPPANSGPNPTVAGILAGFFPIGVGAVYAGQYAKGLSHLVIMVLLILGLGSDLPWYVITMLAIATGFFYFYQIIDAVRTAKAVQEGQPAPDPFGLAAAFGAGEKFEGTKVPAGAAILIGLGVLFLLHTAGLFEFGLDRFWPLILIFLGVWLFAKQWGLVSSSRAVCQCQNCRTRRLMGPAILVTLGVLFLLDSVSRVGFGRTWPAILLVIGVVKLLQSNASPAGHVGPLPPGSPGYSPAAVPPDAPAVTPGTMPGTETSSGEVKNV
jgi:cell wall-active antibiotic response 4TMS protein YvqF/B-box zinc finger protein